MWLYICQGLLLLGWVTRLFGSVIWACNGRDALEPSGAAGVIGILIWSALTGAVLWRSGALSTILP